MCMICFLTIVLQLVWIILNISLNANSFHLVHWSLPVSVASRFQFRFWGAWTDRCVTNWFCICIYLFGFVARHFSKAAYFTSYYYFRVMAVVPGELGQSFSVGSTSFTCSRRESLGISGTVLSWARCPSCCPTSVRAQEETKHQP